MAAFEGWSPTLFLEVGVMWLVAAAINSLLHFAGVPSTEVLRQVFISGAMLIS